jgi:uncharacterized membrane protein YbhN (UPF0104 family)
MKTKRSRFILLSLLSLVIIAGLVFYLYVHADKYLELLRLSAGGVAMLLLLSLAFPFFNGLINTYMFQSLGAPLSFREGFFLAGTATLANQLPIPGGIVARGVYLKYKHGLSYTAYFSAALALFLGMVVVNGLVGVGVLLYLFIARRETVSIFLLSGFAAMAASSFVFIIPVSRLKIPQSAHKWIDQALQGWALISLDHILLFKLLGMGTVEMFLLAARYWVAFGMFSQDITASQAVLLSAATILTQLISLAPGGLGVREIIVGSVASALGFDVTVSVAAVELDRLISTLMIVLIGWISAIALGRQISEASVREHVQGA